MRHPRAIGVERRLVSDARLPPRDSGLVRRRRRDVCHDIGYAGVTDRRSRLCYHASSAGTSTKRVEIATAPAGMMTRRGPGDEFGPRLR